MSEEKPEVESFRCSPAYYLFQLFFPFSLFDMFYLSESFLSDSIIIIFLVQSFLYFFLSIFSFFLSLFPLFYFHLSPLYISMCLYFHSFLFVLFRLLNSDLDTLSLSLSLSLVPGVLQNQVWPHRGQQGQKERERERDRGRGREREREPLFGSSEQI